MLFWFFSFPPPHFLQKHIHGCLVMNRRNITCLLITPACQHVLSEFEQHCWNAAAPHNVGRIQRTGRNGLMWGGATLCCVVFGVQRIFICQRSLYITSHINRAHFTYPPGKRHIGNVGHPREGAEYWTQSQHYSSHGSWNCLGTAFDLQQTVSVQRKHEPSCQARTPNSPFELYLLTFSFIICWYDDLSAKDRNNIVKVQQRDFQSLWEKQMAENSWGKTNRCSMWLIY